MVFSFSRPKGSYSAQHLRGEKLKGAVMQHCERRNLQVFLHQRCHYLTCAMQAEKHTFFGANLHSQGFVVRPCRVTGDKLVFEPIPAPLLLLFIPSPFRSWCFTVVAPSANLSLLFVIICANYHRCAWVASRHWHGDRGDRALSEANALIHHSNIEPSAERSHCLQQANDQE